MKCNLNAKKILIIVFRKLSMWHRHLAGTFDKQCAIRMGKRGWVVPLCSHRLNEATDCQVLLD